MIFPIEISVSESYTWGGEEEIVIAFKIDCEYLIDANVYHDAPSSITIYPTTKDLEDLSKVIQNAIQKARSLK